MEALRKKSTFTTVKSIHHFLLLKWKIQKTSVDKAKPGFLWQKMTLQRVQTSFWHYVSYPIVTAGIQQQNNNRTKTLMVVHRHRLPIIQKKKRKKNRQEKGLRDGFSWTPIKSSFSCDQRISQHDDDRVPSEEHFRNVAVLIHWLRLLLSLPALWDFCPHLLHVLQDHVAVPERTARM